MKAATSRNASTPQVNAAVVGGRELSVPTMQRDATASRSSRLAAFIEIAVDWHRSGRAASGNAI
jgi:hypothetical protein